VESVRMISVFMVIVLVERGGGEVQAARGLG